MIVKFLSAVFFVFSTCVFLHAQELAENTKTFQFSDLFAYENPVTKGDNEKKWTFNATGGNTGKSGNTDTVTTTFGGALKFDNNITEFRIGYTGSYGKLKGVVNDNKGTGVVNFDHYLFWRLEFFSYTMSDYNRITHLAHRNGSGAGGKFFFIRNRYMKADISGAPIFQYEDFEDQQPDKQWRWSVRGRVQVFPIADRLSIKYYVFYIPVIGDREEYRTIQEFTVELGVTDKLLVKTGYYREFNTYNERAYQKNPLLKKTDSTVYMQAGVNL